MASGLRRDLAKTQILLDECRDREVVVDEYGNAWQKSSYLGLWYRAFDGAGLSSFDAAQLIGGKATVLTGAGGES